MKRIPALLALTMLAWIGQQSAAAEPDPQQARQIFESLHWVRGPTTVTVGSKGKFLVPEHYVFLNPQDTDRIMELMQNPSTGGKQNYFAPDDYRWFAVFRHDETGHIPDDEKVDPAAILQTIKSGTTEANKIRTSRGWSSLTILGWRYEPFYDPATKRLEWAIDSESENERNINYNARILARTGVTSAILVTDPTTINTAVPEFKRVIAGYSFIPGEGYSEFRQGDRVAEYGLAALVAGGAAAVATKKGLWAIIGGFLAVAWKMVVAVVLGLGAWLKSAFRKKS